MKVGYAFADHIGLQKKKRKKDNYNFSFSFRRAFLLGILFVLGATLVMRLIYLQLIKGDYYQGLSDVNRTRTKIIHAPRGVIFDRNNKPLVFNIPGYRKITGDKVELLDHSNAIAKIAQGDSSIEIDTLREYPFKDAMSHILGYIGQVTDQDRKQSEQAMYQLHDFIGKDGIEQSYESVLRGKDGRQLLEVNAVGKVIRTLGQTDPIPGKDIKLTIDTRLQQLAFAAMKEVKKGALIASTPTGQILAMVSKPDFDPNLFTLGKHYLPASSSAYFKVSDILLDQTGEPLLNRAISGLYPPGSTFKIVVAASGLENKVIDGKFSVLDTGVITLGTFSFSNWYYTEYGKTEAGEVDIRRAIARSNDIFFYKLADMLKVDRLSQTSGKFGIGQKLGIDLLGEASGVLPSREWKEKNIHDQWYTGDTFHYGIGQGYLLTTPLQVNSWSEVIANQGKLYRPQLNFSSDSKILEENIVSSETRSLIHEGMKQACSTGGTAYPLFDLIVDNPDLAVDNKNFFAVSASQAAGLKANNLRRVSVACKTGTAQQGGEKDNPHAWITLYAPSEDPQIVMTVLNEASGEGSQKAAPIAAEVLRGWFSKQ